MKGLGDDPRDSDEDEVEHTCLANNGEGEIDEIFDRNFKNRSPLVHVKKISEREREKKGNVYVRERKQEIVRVSEREREKEAE